MDDLEPLAWNVEGLESREVRFFHVTDLLRRQCLVCDLVVIELEVRLRQPSFVCNAEDSDYVVAATTHDVSVRKGRYCPYRDGRMGDGLNTFAVCTPESESKPRGGVDGRGE